MQYALHPHENRFIDVEAYTRESGNQPIGHPGPWKPTPPRCPYCPARLQPRARSPIRIAHFKHPKGAICPSTARAGQPYHGLTPQQPDGATAAVLFNAFLADWPSHYRAVRSLVPCLNADEFEETVTAATQANSWAWVDMPIWAVPYMLILQRDYPPQRPVARAPLMVLRELWFRFWFHHEARPLDALWIHVDGAPQLVRASYRLKPGQRRPTEDELTKDPIRFPIGPMLLADAQGQRNDMSAQFVARLDGRLHAIRARLHE